MRFLYLVFCILRPFSATAQTPLSFEVASVKPVSSCPEGSRSGVVSPGRLFYPCITLRDLVRIAYSEGDFSRFLLVSGGPHWLDSDLFQIDAKAADAVSVAQMRGPMLQHMIAERFDLKFHRSGKEVPGYALTVAPRGSTLARTKEGSCVPRQHDSAVERERAVRYCGTGRFGQTFRKGVFTIECFGVTMDEFAHHFLAANVRRPVVNRTGLAGLYDIHVDFSLDESTESAVPSIFMALQEQLGLKLIVESTPIDVLMIDTAQRPTQN